MPDSLDDNQRLLAHLSSSRASQLSYLQQRASTLDPMSRWHVCIMVSGESRELLADLAGAPPDPLRIVTSLKYVTPSLEPLTSTDWEHARALGERLGYPAPTQIARLSAAAGWHLELGIDLEPPVLETFDAGWDCLVHVLRYLPRGVSFVWANLGSDKVDGAKGMEPAV